LRAADFLVLRHFQNRVHRFLLRRVNEAAGIDDDDVRLVGLGREFMPARGELTHHDFAIDQIFGAAEADKTDFQVFILPWHRL
jgi:hypothetical protein